MEIALVLKSCKLTLHSTMQFQILLCVAVAGFIVINEDRQR